MTRELQAEVARLRGELALRDAALAEMTQTAQRLKETEAALQRHERDMRAILDNLPSMIGYWDTTLHNRFANQAYSTWFGIDYRDIPGKHIREVIGEERFRLNLPFIEGALRGEEQVFERAIPAPDGSMVRHSLAHYIPDVADGAVQGFFVLVSDITAVKLAEKALEESALGLRTMLEVSPIAVGIVSPDTRRILFSNRSYRRMLHGDDDPCEPGGDDALCRAVVDQCAAGRMVCDQLVELSVPHRGTAWVLATCLPMAFEGKPAVVGWFYEVTALKEMEERLRRANQDLEQFAYAASHDLREPLRMISSYVSLLDRRYGATMEPDAREFIAFARDGARRLDQMILDLLEFSRVGRSGDAPGPVSLDDIVAEAAANLRVAAQEAGGTITVEPGLGGVVGTRGELVRLFQNLLGNAIKYRAPGRPPQVNVSAKASGKERVISVADNGIGIAAEFSERVFSIFQRLHTRDAYEGNGIGLAICRKIVQHHDGRIWVDSVPGQGSTFRVALPG